MKIAILAAVCAGALAASIATAKLPAPPPPTESPWVVKPWNAGKLWSSSAVEVAPVRSMSPRVMV